MCKRSLLLLLVLAAPSSARGQEPFADAAARAAQERARVDSLLPLLRAENVARLERQRRVQAEKRAKELQRAGKLDTTMVGPLLVVGRGGTLEQGVRRIGTLWAEYEPLLGATAAQLQGTVFVITSDDSGILTRGLLQLPRHYAVPVTSLIHRADRDAVVQSAFGATLQPLLPAALQRWINHASFVPRAQRTRAYRDLAVGSSVGSTRCLAGDVGACAAVLGLTDPGADWSRWYTLAQLRTRVLNSGCGRGSGNQCTPQFYQCVDRADDAACVTAFADAGAPGPLAGSVARASFVEYTLVHGGAGSFERLVQDSVADVYTALTRAAGGNLDPVIAGWRDAVVAARPRVYADLGQSLLVTLVWCGLLMTLALRSTRWRLG